MPRPPQFDLTRDAYGRPFADLLRFGAAPVFGGSTPEAVNDPGPVRACRTGDAPRRPLNAATIANVAVSALLEVAARRR